MNAVFRPNLARPASLGRPMASACRSYLGNPHGRNLDESIMGPMLRRNFFGSLMAAGTPVGLAKPQREQEPRQISAGVVLEPSATGQPHKGKVLLALQAHSDDVPLMAAGTVAKL